MDNEKKKAAEVLKRAMRGEEDGYRFYDLLSKKASNSTAKKLLESLRDDEIRHKQTLQEIWDRHIGGEVGELPDKGLSVLTEIFRKGHVEDRHTEIEFVNLAIEAELAATRYYKAERDLIEDETFRNIFDKLADEEHHHFELLQAEKDAMGGNYSWFEYDDTQPLEH